MHSTEDVESTALARKDEPSLTCDIYIYIYIYMQEICLLTGNINVARLFWIIYMLT